MACCQGHAELRLREKNLKRTREGWRRQRRAERVHGTHSMYSAGCRCDACHRGHAATIQLYRLKKAGKPMPVGRPRKVWTALKETA